MKVILQQNVQKLGKAGDIVEASDGYFRNFLQPRKLALVATNGTLKKREEDLSALQKKAEKAHEEALAHGEKINSLGTIHLCAKTGEGGKLYGKITNKEISTELEKHLGAPVDKRLIKTNDDISALGQYKVHVKLTPEVTSELMLEVHPEGWVYTEPKPLAAVSAGAADQAPEVDSEADYESDEE